MEENINTGADQIEKILSMVKLMNSMNNREERDEPTENKTANEIVEKMDAGTALNKIKAAVPFLDMPYKRNIGLMLKIMEIDSLVNNFRVMSLSGERNNSIKRKMLMALRPELDVRKQKIVDVFVRVMEISDIMEGLKNE